MWFMNILRYFLIRRKINMIMISYFLMVLMLVLKFFFLIIDLLIVGELFFYCGVWIVVLLLVLVMDVFGVVILGEVGGFGVWFKWEGFIVVFFGFG